MKTKLILDINKTQYAQLNSIVTGRVGDKVSNVVDVYVIDGGIPYNLTGLKVFFECAKPDNTVIRDDTGVKIIDAAKGYFEYTFPPETFGAIGKAKQAFMSIEKDKTIRATTQDFVLITLPDATTNRIPSESYLSDLDKLIQELNEMALEEINSQAAADASAARQFANQANELSNSTQKQLNEIVINGDSSVEAAQARLDAENKAFPTLKERIDNEQKKFSSFKKRAEVINTATDTKGALDVANFAGQGNANAPIGFVYHHYTDGGVYQIDNVGEANTILTLKNAQNPNRRPDKPADFVGSGKFLALHEHDASAGYSKEMFYISKIGEFIWTGVKGIATLIQNKVDNATFAFRLKVNNAHAYVLSIANGANEMLNINNSVNKTRVDIISPPSQTNGMFLETKAGNMRVLPKDGFFEVIGDLRIGDGATWKNIQYIESGPTSQRPTIARIGQRYFDTDLNKPIYRNKNNNGWVDSNGVGVS